ncbi:NEL-type E3 ubiquitin ligase domain-containing protein, partial [Pseudomonas carnis]|uniref:NEL-type E3 ubiquitin ligase domain-containing protein n=1 Tax=Pseudomonas carnis TaxID=2487355 RepID=UPI0023514918
PLKLRNMIRRTSTGGFLARHQGVRWLDMSRNQLRELPPALGQMHGLTRLSLQNNQIRLNPESAAMLASRSTLRALILNSNPLDIAPDFSQMTDLRSLGMGNTHIETFPTGLGAQPSLDAVYLRGSRISTLPDALIAPSDEALAQSLRVTSVTDLGLNPLSAETQARIADYNRRLTDPERAANRLVRSTLEVAVPQAVTGDSAPFQRWARGLSTQLLAQRRSQWSTLRALPGADGFFDMLRDLKVASAEYEDVQRRVWEVIDAIASHSAESEQLRKEMFEWAGQATCCDRAALTFGNLEILLMTSNAKAQALDSTQGAALVKLSRGLFRLEEVEKIALTDIDQRRTAINSREDLTATQKADALRALEEVEIRLAYRYGLKERLDLPGQAQQTRFIHFGNVSQAMLDAAYDKVIGLDNSVHEFQAMLAREFWQDYIANKYRSRFEAQNQPHHEQMNALLRDFESGAISRAVFDSEAEALQGQFAIEEAQLIQTLSRDEVAQALMPTANLEVLVEAVGQELQLSEAQTIEFNGKQYFVASMPDAGDGEHYILRVQAPQNPLALVSSGVVAKPDIHGVWKRRGLAGGMKPQGSYDEFFDLRV